MDLNQVTLPSTNYDESVRFYRTMGLRQIVDSPPRYARFETGAGTTLSIHAVGAEAEGACVVVYFEVDNVDLEVRKLKNLGLKFESEPTDQDWLWREAYLYDPSGNRLCIYNAGDNRRFPPWRLADEVT
ncbi:MAG: VOC family protein [Woeseiaceae bacterium]